MQQIEEEVCSNSIQVKILRFKYEKDVVSSPDMIILRCQSEVVERLYTGGSLERHIFEKHSFTISHITKSSQG